MFIGVRSISPKNEFMFMENRLSPLMLMAAIPACSWSSFLIGE
ncbi:MAG: hypothetical protein WC889_06510 [Myxococcota bacterium]